jgi:PucR C-terminal helix-turn-helix domain
VEPPVPGASTVMVATSAAAAKLHVHRNTVRYRLRRLEELTDRSLSRPIGVAELHLALEAIRILHLEDSAAAIAPSEPDPARKRPSARTPASVSYDPNAAR